MVRVFANLNELNMPRVIGSFCLLFVTKFGYCRGILRKTSFSVNKMLLIEVRISNLFDFPHKSRLQVLFMKIINLSHNKFRQHIHLIDCLAMRQIHNATAIDRVIW